MGLRHWIRAESPATLSRLVLGKLLRDELRFDGLIVTDAMGQWQVWVKQFGAAESNKRAIEAVLMS